MARRPRLKISKLQDEWQLLLSVAQKIFRIYGTPDIDLFASNVTAQLGLYFTLDSHNSRAHSVDALGHLWDFQTMYAFPPPSLILTVLQKYRRFSGILLLVAPFWPDAHWLPEVRSLFYREPRQLRFRESLMINRTTGYTLPSLNRLRLTVRPLSWPSSPVQESQRKLLNSSLLLGGGLRQSSIGQSGGPGCPGVKTIVWTQLPFL